MSEGFASGQAPDRVTPPGAATNADSVSRYVVARPFRSFSGPFFYPDGDGGGDPPADPPKPADPPADPPKPAATPTLAELQQQLESATKQIGELRQEAAKHRTTANDYKTKLDELDREKLTKEQQLEADVKRYRDEVLPELQKRTRSLEVQVAASEKNVVDPEAAAQLLDWTSVDQGASIAEALDALIAAKPWLVKQTAAPAAAPATTSPAAGTSSTGQKTSFTEAEIDAMSDADYEANRAAIFAALRNGKVARGKS